MTSELRGSGQTNVHCSILDFVVKIRVISAVYNSESMVRKATSIVASLTWPLATLSCERDVQSLAFFCAEADERQPEGNTFDGHRPLRCLEIDRRTPSPGHVDPARACHCCSCTHYAAQARCILGQQRRAGDAAILPLGDLLLQPFENTYPE